MIRLARHLLHLVLLAGLLAGLACSGSSEADSAADATSASVPTTAPPPEPPPPRRRPKPDLPEPVVVLEDASDSQAPSLVEAARRERERKKEAKPSQVVITDENLAEHATGQVTVAAPPETAETEDEDGATAEAIDLGRDEIYWRDGVRDRRLRLRRAVDEVLALEEQVAGLRLRFYAEDDPYVRDSRIKPAWDRSLERLRQARQDVTSYRRDLDEFLAAGHRAGALPGWLREAAELEPSAEEIRQAVPEEDQDVDRHRPKDPDAVDPNPNRDHSQP